MCALCVCLVCVCVCECVCACVCALCVLCVCVRASVGRKELKGNVRFDARNARDATSKMLVWFLAKKKSRRNFAF